jgi:hypothetical protein
MMGRQKEEKRMKAEGGRMNDNSCFIPHPSSFISHPSSFIMPLQAVQKDETHFILHPFSFILQ